MAAIAPPAIEGVYGQSTYSGFVASAMVDQEGGLKQYLANTSFGSASIDKASSL